MRRCLKIGHEQVVLGSFFGKVGIARRLADACDDGSRPCPDFEDSLAT